MNMEKIMVSIVRPDLCAVCPRRSMAGRAMAEAVLGANYQAPGCSTDQIVDDPDLKNRLFDQGLIDTPHGLRATPEYVNEVVTPIVFSHPRGFSMNVRFSLSGRVCPQDVT